MKKSPTRSSANKAKAKAMYLHQGPDHRAPKIAQGYDEAFRVGEAYRASLPDMMEATGPLKGGAVAIQQVGVSNFRMPLSIAAKRGAPVQVEASVSGTVSVAARQRGINMSRLVRTFYRKSETVFTPGTLAGILRAYRRELGSTEARLTLRFSYPMIQRSLRSGLEGYQYYKVAFDARCQADGAVRTFVEFDFVYSSACPCSAELAEHARDVRGVYSIPHNQRSKARLRVELAPGARVSLEDLRDLCVRALRTETQVMVKREDEQAFAELNGAHLKFVEDAARLLHSELVKERRFVDFQAACVHLESLHSHDAVSVICKGVKGGLTADFSDFQSLVC